jgi:hypothetical protein
MQLKSVVLSIMLGGSVCAQTIQPPFDANYTFTSLGEIADVPFAYGGLTLHPDDPDLLLIAGNANTFLGAIYAIEVERDACGQISGFVGTASLYAEAPYIDGGLAFNDAGILFATTYPFNQVYQFLPGATQPSRIDDLTDLGLTASTGSCGFVPSGFPGAGRFKVLIYAGGNFYDVTLTPDGLGTYNLSNPVLAVESLTTGPEGIAYIPSGSPNFSVPSLVVAEFGLSSIAAFEVDSQGDPIASTRRVFMEGFGGAQGAFIDPGTGDFLFGSFAGGGIVIVRGFAAATDCDSIDFNNDGSFFDPVDIDAFLSVFSEGPCIPETATCNDIDFDNNGSCFDPNDIDSFLSVFSEGPCL